MCPLFLGGCTRACGFTALSSFAQCMRQRARAGVERRRGSALRLQPRRFPGGLGPPWMCCNSMCPVARRRGSRRARQPCLYASDGVAWTLGEDLSRAARRHPAHHRPAVAHRRAPDHRGEGRGADPRLAHGAGTDQPEAVQPRPPRVRLLRPPLRVRPADARTRGAGVARRARHLDELHHRLPRLQRPQGQPPARGSAHDACCTCLTCPTCTKT